MSVAAKEGAACMLASSPCDCTGSLFGPPPIPAVIYSVPGSSLWAPPPKFKDHNPGIAIGLPVMSLSAPRNAPVVALKALIFAIREISHQKRARERSEIGGRDRHAP